ncbi:MAG TPA: DNA repair protein RecN [Bryobacteraceae bacterium]|nr:DNA repair protein RecN [Bryobacteraceae bacterium]
MLVELTVENYAVVDRLRVRFHTGLNLLTGETGSGKSIVVDALGLLLGGRASGEMIRSGEDRARVAGIFEVRDDRAVRAALDQAGVDIEDGELLIEREVLGGGKSRAFVANRPATAALLRELAPHLGDIHGQHDQQLLFQADTQREMLDNFAGAQKLLGEVGESYQALRQVDSELADIERSEQEKLRMLDLWQFQRREIESLRLQPGEDATLENERRVLQNLGRILETAGGAYAALYDSPESAVALTRLAAKKLEELARIDPALGEIRETLKPAEIALSEAAYALRDYLGRLEANPARLEEIETRLAAIDKAKRKYGTSIEEMLGYLDQVARNIDAVQHAGERMEQLRAERHKLSEQYEALAGKLTARRTDAAAKLAKRVETELAALAMERAVFEIAIRPADASASGKDAVEFLVSPNLGEAPKPIEKIASGGEISRIALALKTCVSAPARANGAIRTLVFDEVDAGIGGGVAEGVGRRLKKLSATNQVLCVTHLAQIACFADHHYLVEKREQKGRTVATVEELDDAARTREIGRMLSGQKVTAEALKHAERLIAMSCK